MRNVTSVLVCWIKQSGSRLAYIYLHQAWNTACPAPTSEHVSCTKSYRSVQILLFDHAFVLSPYLPLSLSVSVYVCVYIYIYIYIIHRYIYLCVTLNTQTPYSSFVIDSLWRWIQNTWHFQFCFLWLSIFMKRGFG